MKKHLSFLMLLAALLVPWAVGAQNTISTFPWSCDFETASDNNVWTISNNSPNGWYIGTAVHSGGTYALYVSNNSGTSNAYDGTTACVSYAYVTFDVASAGQYAVQFDWKCGGESTYDFLRVAVASSSTALPTTYSDWTATSVPTNFMAVDGGSKLNLQGTTWQTHTAVVSVPAAGSYRLIFVWRNDGSVTNSDPAAVDNIVITELTCPQPTALTAIASVDQLDLSWTAGGSETEWLVVLNDSIEASVYTNSYTATNLEGNTPYTVKLYAVCGMGDTSLPTIGHFRTECTLIDNMPYSYGFEDMATGSSSAHPEIPCWNHLNNGTSYFGYPYVSSTNPHGGSRNLYWYSTTTTGTYGDYQVVVLPGVDTDIYPINNLQLSFWVRPTATSYNCTFIVGVMTDPSSINTFQQVQTINVTGTTTWQQVTAALGNFTGSGNHIAVRVNRPSSSWYAYTDDFMLETIPTCPPITTFDAEAGIGSAMLSWTIQSGIPGTPVGYVVTYDSVGSTGSPTVENTTETNITLTNLVPGTTYKAYVYADCGGDGYGRMDSVVFSTASLGCAELDSANADTTIFSNSTSGISGCLAYSSYGNTVYQAIWTAAELAAAGMSAGPITGIDLGFTACSSYNKEFTVFIGSTSVSSISDANMINPNQQTQVYGPAIHPMNTSGWQHYDFSTPFNWDGTSNIIITTFMNQYGSSQSSSTGLTGYYVSASNKARYRYRDSSPFTLSDYNSGNSGSTYSYRAAIHFYQAECLVQAACAAPTVMVTDVQSGEVTIAWAPGYDETSWDVDYRVSGTDTWTNAAVGVTATTYTITGLTPATHYEFRVGFSCSDGHDYYTSVEAATECTAMTLPIIENFDGITGSTATSNVANNLPLCWDYYNDGTRTNYQGCPYVYNSGTYAHSGTNSIRFYTYNSSGDSNQYLILPIIDSTLYQMDELQLSFWVRGNSTSSGYFNNVVVGVMTDATDESSFIPYDTILSTTTTYTYYEINFNHYTGPFGRVTMLFPKPASSSQYEYGYVDDVMLGLIPTCLSVENLSATYASADSIIISWTPGNSESMWEVTYGTNTVIVNDTFYVADNLNSNTEYTFSVRAICTAGDTSYAATCSARTDCGPITVLPYIEGFEGLPVGSSTNLDCGVPCWGRLDDAGQNHFGYVGSPSSWPTGAHTGTGFLYYYIPTTTGTHANWIITILPAIDVNVYPINTLQVSFWVKMNSTTTADDIQVGVISNTSDETTFIPIDTVHVAGNTFELKTAYLSNYVDTTGASHIAFKFLRDVEANYFFIDDVTIEQIPDCPPVSNINLAGMTSDSLYVTWSENGNATQWNIEYGPAGFTLGTGITDVATSIPYAIGGLTANTAYDVYVTPDCDNGVAGTRMGTFHTDCGPTPVPFTENFDTWSSTAADPLPNCWEKHTNYSTNYPYASTSYNHGNGGSKSMYMYSTSTTYSYMVLPAFALPVDSTQISFWLYKSNTSYAHKLQVGVMTNPADVSTFVQVAEVVPTVSSAWEQFEVSFNNYTGTGTRIAIMSPNGEYSYPYLDDLMVTRVSPCPRVSDLTAASVMLDSAIITWTDNSATSWYVQYDTINFIPGSAGHNATQVTDTFCVLSGLDSGTMYHVYVYPDCDSVIAERYITFSTLASAPGTVPYSCTFEAAGVNGWDFIQAGQGNYWVVGNATNNGGSRSMYVTDNGSTNNYSGNASYSFATRTFSLAAGNYICSYDWKCNGESSYDFIRAALVPAGVILTAGEYSGFDNASAMPGGSIALDGGNRMNLQTNWQSEVAEFTLAAPGTYKLVFLWRNDGSVYNNPPAAIDNVQLVLNTCPMPQNITLNNLTQTGTDVTWSEVGSATMWEYQVGTGTPVIVNDTTCSISGLSANTAYTFRVRSICGAGDTSAWVSYNFRTPCGYITLPYTQDFETESTSSSTTGSAFANCWTRLNNGTSYGGYPYVSSNSTYNHTTGGSKGLYWYNTTTTGTYGDYQCVVLPPIDPSTSVDSLQLSFWAKVSSTSYTMVFKVGVMTDPNNIATFVGVDTITVNSTTWTEIEVPLATYTGSGSYVAVKVDRATSAYAYVDDFNLDYIPSCVSPRNIVSPVSTSNTITIDWTDITPASEWEIRYNNNGVNNIVTTTSHPYIVMGLNAMTAYDFEVRAICGVGDTSYWSLPATVSTAMCDNPVVATNWDSTMTPTTSQYSPIGYSFYNYSYVQTIIDSAHMSTLNGAEITAFAFQPTVTDGGNEFENMTVYMANVPENNLSAGWITPNATHVFVKVIDNASFSYTTTGTHYIGFDSVFTWDGHSNVLFSVKRDNGDYTQGSTFAAHTASSQMMRYDYNDDDPYSHTNPSLVDAGTATNIVGDIILVSCGGCANPFANVTDITYESATITVVGNGESYELQYGTDINNLGNTMTSTTNVFNLTGLQPATQYFFQVRQNCGDNEMSGWGIGTFITDSLPCMAVSNLTLVGTTFNSISVSWTANGEETAWEVNVFSTIDDTTVTVMTTSATVSGLVSERLYNISVRPMCGTNHNIEGPWSDTIQATTDQCQPVTGLTVSNIGATMATVGWTAPAGAEHFRVIYGLPNFDQGGELGTYNTESNPFVLTELEANSDYTVRVANVCAENLVSQWTSADFSTTGVGINGVEFDGGLSIYPNPASTTVTLSVSEQMAGSTVSIVDVNGRVVSEFGIQNSEFRIDVSDMAKGAYFVRITGEQTTVVRKLIVE